MEVARALSVDASEYYKSYIDIYRDAPNMDTVEWFTNTIDYHSWTQSRGSIIWHPVSENSEKNLYSVFERLIRVTLPGHFSIYCFCDQANRISSQARGKMPSSTGSVVQSAWIIRSIIGQMLCAIFESYPGKSNEADSERSLFRELWKPTVSPQSLWPLLNHILAHHQELEFTLIIHRLDVCVFEERATFVEILRKLESPNVRILITSLPCDDISSELDRAYKLDSESEWRGEYPHVM